MPSKTKMSNKLFKKRKILLGLSLVLLVVLVGAFWHYHKKPIPAVIPTRAVSKSKPPTDNQPSAATNTSKVASPEGESPSASPGQLSLLAPYGPFVSNHNPGGQDNQGNTTPYSEVSVCDSTPGATCYIKFTNGQSSTQLPSQTISNDGSTRWDWDVNNDAHLTKGSWQVTAVASLNGQTKSTDDSIKLTIQ